MSTIKFTKDEKAKADAKGDRRSLPLARPAHAEMREAMDMAMARITLEDIAKTAGCGVNALKQARMAPGSTGYRKPPAGLQRALHELCKEQARYFIRLAEQLRPKS
jgi:hypothetical protein